MLRTLIVEDDFISRKILNAFLTPLGLCDVAVNGPEAIAAFKAALAGNEAYQLICLDIGMPGMDGHQVLSAIRTIEECHGLQGLDRVRVIMTTGSADPKDVRAAFRSECDAYLVKPIEQTKLIGHLRELGLLPEE